MERGRYGRERRGGGYGRFGGRGEIERGRGGGRGEGTLSSHEPIRSISPHHQEQEDPFQRKREYALSNTPCAI